MKHLPPRRSSLFLMELLIAILFFSLASAVCIRFFAQSHQLSSNATQLHMAVIQAQNMEEAVIGCEGSLETIAGLYPNCTCTENELTVFYNTDWEISKKEDSIYSLVLTLSGDTLQNGAIYVYSVKNGMLLYQLPVTIKIPAVFEQEG